VQRGVGLGGLHHHVRDRPERGGPVGGQLGSPLVAGQEVLQRRGERLTDLRVVRRLDVERPVVAAESLKEWHEYVE
jgi:hypothetical protein